MGKVNGIHMDLSWTDYGWSGTESYSHNGRGLLARAGTTEEYKNTDRVSRT